MKHSPGRFHCRGKDCSGGLRSWLQARVHGYTWLSFSSLLCEVGSKTCTAQGFPREEMSRDMSAVLHRSAAIPQWGRAWKFEEYLLVAMTMSDSHHGQ